MPVREFEIFVEDAKKEFGNLLQMADGKGNFYIDFIMRLFAKCTNDFEELTLVENLKEVYEQSKLCA